MNKIKNNDDNDCQNFIKKLLNIKIYMMKIYYNVQKI